MSTPDSPLLTPEPRRNRHRLFGCLGLLVLCGGLTWWIVVRSLATLHWGCGETVVWSAERACMQCGLSDAQQKRVLEPVLDFAAKIREERYSLPSGLGLIRRFDRGPLFASLFLSGLASRLQEQGEAGETVGASSTRMTALFLEVYRQNPVASATLTSLQELVTIKQELTFRRPSGLVIRTMAPVMKPDLTPEERASALALMQSAIAGAGNRPETPLRIDPVAAVTEAIQGVLGEENSGSTSAERNQ